MEKKSEYKRKLKILFLTARFPFPVIGGDRLKPYNVLAHLAKEHDVTLVSFYQGRRIPAKYQESIRSLGIDTHIIPLNPVSSGLKSIFKLLYTGYPLEISYYLSGKFKKKVDELISEKDFDIGFSFFMRTAEYLKDKPFKKILMAEDCRRLYQKRSFEKSGNLFQKIVRYIEYKKLNKYEPEIIRFFDFVTLVTEEDIESMQQENKISNLRLLTNGVDTNKFVPPPENKREGILFAGKLDVWANQLMIQQIIKEILPEIRKEIPDLTFNIVGANPPRQIQNFIKNSKNIKLLPNVPDMLPFLQKAELFIHPHNGGSGIQNKLLEAMSCGCPVVTTATGNQGINAKDTLEVLIGKNSEELAQKAIMLLKDKEFSEKISVNARLLIERTHSWNLVFNTLDNLLFELTVNNNV